MTKTPTQTTQTEASSNRLELQRNSVFVMDGGALTVKLNGPTPGWASLVIKSDQLVSDDEYATWEIPPSELRQLRDWLNKTLPARIAGVHDAQPAHMRTRR